MASFDYRGFWFIVKFLFLFFLAVFLARNTPYLFFNTDFDSNGDNRIKRVVFTASLTEIDDKPIKLAFAGDIMLARNVKDTIEANGGDYGFPFVKIKNELRSFDLLFANLEGSISDRGENLGSIYSFRMSPKAAESLRDAGFDVLSVANNHIGDWGTEAIYDTISYLKRVGLIYVGVGLTEEEALGAKILEVGDTSIAFLAFTDVPSLYNGRNNEAFVAYADSEAIQKQITKAKNTADIVIVSFHFGEEYRTDPTARQIEIARYAIDSGADLIIGSHPHIVQPIEKYNGAYIAYSLGNFVFDQDFSSETMGGMLLEVVVENKKVVNVIPRKIKLNSKFQPQIVE